MTTQEVVSNDAEACEEVFEEDLETDSINPRTRLRVRSRRLVLSVGSGEAVARPSNPKIIEQLDGGNEPDKDDSIDEFEKKDDGDSVVDKEVLEDIIEQFDGNAESTVTFDLTISALTLTDAFNSIEENLCSKEDSPKIPFISDVPSKEVRDEDKEDNTLFTLEVRFDNEKKFLAKVERIFHNWDPLWFGKPRGILSKFVKRD